MARKMKTMDGNNAAAHVSYAFTDVAAIYPITPSSVMAEVTDKWSADGRKNIFGQEVKVVEMQSEAGAAGAVHGSLAAGALTTTFTASQGLLLMIPNMYKMAGELLPGVIHVSARALASHALSIFGDHSDVYACRQTGFAMLCSASPQEVMDLGAVAHLAAIKGRVPFLHFFDGFRTSHEIQKIEVWDYEDLDEMLDYGCGRRRSASALLNPEHPVLRGSAQNPDIFFQAARPATPTTTRSRLSLRSTWTRSTSKIGTNYKPLQLLRRARRRATSSSRWVRSATPSRRPSTTSTRNGDKVGLVKVRLYRPFSAKHLIARSRRRSRRSPCSTAPRSPAPSASRSTSTLCAALKGSKFENVPVFGGRYGLGSKDTTPAQIIAVYNNCQTRRRKTASPSASRTM